MLIKLFSYTSIFIVFTFASLRYLEHDHTFTKEILSNLKVIAPILSTAFVGFILYVKNTLKELGKLDRLRSHEVKIVMNFSSRCNTQLWINVSFYAFVLFYGIILPFITFSEESYKNIAVSIFFGLLFLEIASLFGVYKLDKSIIEFQAYIMIRAKKIEEKNAALAELNKDCEFSESDKAYFNKRKNIINNDKSTL